MSPRCLVDGVLVTVTRSVAGTVDPSGVFVGEGRVGVVSGDVGDAGGVDGQGLSDSDAAGPVIGTGGTGIVGAVSVRVGRGSRGGPSGIVGARGHGLVSACGGPFTSSP